MEFKKPLLVACLIIIGISCACSLFAPKDNLSVQITEVCSDYGEILYDADGPCHGFVELYNNSDRTIDLDGWYISDNTLQRKKYRITEFEIEPHSYAVFWSNSLTDVEGIIEEGIFLGFSLNEHETVILSDPSGKTVSKLRIPSLEKGMSYAKGSTGMWGMRAATPNGESTSAIRSKSSKVLKPVMSKPSGFYEDQLALEIYAAPGLEVYYTTDGRKPTKNSNRYVDALCLEDATGQDNRYSMQTDISTIGVYTPQYLIPKINVIRAIAVDGKGNESDVVTASYFVGYKDRYGFQDVMMLSVVTDPANLFRSDVGIYVLGDVWTDNLGKLDTTVDAWQYNALSNYVSSGKGWRRPALFELYDKNQQLVASQEGRISIHGGWSVTYNQKSFNLYSNNDEMVLFPGIFDSASSSVMLRAGGFRDLYSTKIRDVFNQKLIADRAVIVQDAVPCQVFINGEYWGLYNLQERISEGLIASTCNVNKNNLVILKNNTVVSGSPEDIELYRDVVSFASNHDLSLAEHYEQMCKWIDIQSYIDYYCFQIYVANCDSVANNFARWRVKNIVDDKYGDGRWRWIPYDTDDSTGMVPGLTSADTDSFSAGHWATTPMSDALFSALIKNESFKAQFVDTFEEMASINFSYLHVNEELNKMQEVYMPATVVSQHRFLSESFTEADYKANIEVIRSFFRERYNYIHQYMITNLELETLGDNEGENREHDAS